MIVVRLPSALQRYADGCEQVEIEAGTVGEALEAVCALYPDISIRLLGDDGAYLPHLAVFLGERRIERSEAASIPVLSRDTITVLVDIVGGAHDVRMRGFRDRATVDETLAVAVEGIAPLSGESIPAGETCGRVLSASVTSDVDVPGFRRATMDGYAVRAQDIADASVDGPVVLEVLVQEDNGFMRRVYKIQVSLNMINLFNKT